MIDQLVKRCQQLELENENMERGKAKVKEENANMRSELDTMFLKNARKRSHARCRQAKTKRNEMQKAKYVQVLVKKKLKQDLSIEWECRVELEKKLKQELSAERGHRAELEKKMKQQHQQIGNS